MEYFDYIIIGGGMSGINTVLNLSHKYPNKSIILIESKNRFGGRIFSIYNKKNNFQYESGAARFHNHHSNLLNLTKKYKLELIKLPPNNETKHYNIDRNYNVNTEKNSIKYFDNCIKFLINISKKYKKEQLMKYTLKEFSIKNLGRKVTQKLIDIFGYTSEFDTLNCYDALRSFKNDFNYNKQFFIIKKGMSELTNRMINDIKKNKNVKLLLNTKVSNVFFENNFYFLESNNNTKFSCNKIIFCIKPTQMMEFPIFNKINNILRNIIPRPLLRIYAAYNKNNNHNIWFENLSRFTTNHPIRHFIPINNDRGLAMISYTDGDDAIFLIGKHYDGTLKKYLHDEFKKIFPNIHINMPYYFSVELWDEGAHYWNKNINSDKMSKELLYPMRDKYPNLYLCGEAFSQQQAWVEGSLISSNNLLKLL